MCADHFEITGHTYLTVVDWFSGWICIYAFKAHEMTDQSLQRVFRDLFIAYGVCEELTTDGGPQFMAHGFQEFLKLWGVYIIVSHQHTTHRAMGEQRWQ